MIDDRCDLSDMPTTVCAHCLGHGHSLIEPSPVEPPRATGRVVWSPGMAEREMPGEPAELPDTWLPENGSAGECRCGKPTRDAAYACDSCADLLARALGDVPWLDEQLEATITKQRAIPTEGGSRGTETALPWHEAAAETRRTLHGLLVMWVRFCDEEGVRHQSRTSALPADTLPALSAWLLWRVDGLALLDIGPEAIDEITDAVAGCHRIIDRRPDRWYAGPCNAKTDDVECGADLYAKSAHGTVECRECKASYDVKARREWLLAEAEDRLAAASDLARAVSWLGAEPLTAARVRKWAERGRIVVKGHDGTRPLYRIGDAIDLLASETSKAG